MTVSHEQFRDPEEVAFDERQARRKADKEYGRHYRRGVTASRNFRGGGYGKSPLERADDRGEPDAWYDGYMDHSKGWL
jgi:hypothetical protein